MNGSTETNSHPIDDRGFTLVELLIVIVILGVLASVAVLGLKGISDRGERSTCMAEYRALITAVESYYGVNREYPVSEDVLVPSFMRTPSSLFEVEAGTGQILQETDPTLNTLDCIVPPASMT